LNGSTFAFAKAIGEEFAQAMAAVDAIEVAMKFRRLNKGCINRLVGLKDEEGKKGIRPDFILIRTDQQAISGIEEEKPNGKTIVQAARW
jgi:hypothetical protein